jgi:hypothetical protein
MSTEIASELRNRFLTNYETSSKIELEMAALQAAPFEGDRNLRNNLVKSTQEQLNQLAQKGNYEHMTVPVMESAKRYSVKSKPIQDNMARYQSYLESLSEAKNNKELDHEDYTGTIKLATRNYSGLVENPDGTYGNAFSGIEYVARPDIQKMINDQIATVAADMFGEEVQNVAVGPNGEYTVKTKTGVKSISPEKIQLAISSVFQDGQVSAYLDRKGDIRTLDLTEEDLMQIKSGSISSLQSQYDQLNSQLKDAKTPEEKAIIQEQMGEVVRQSGELNSLTDTEQLRALAKQREISDIVSGYANAAMAASYSEQETSTIVSWDALFLKNQKTDAENLSDMSNVQLAGRLFEQVSPQGVTYDNIISSVTEAKDNVKNLLSLESLQEAGIDTNVFTSEDIMNMPYEDLVKRAGLDGAKHILNRRDLVVENQNMAAAAEKALQESKQSVGLTDEVVLANYVNNVSGASELISEVSSSLNTSEIETASLLNNYLKFSSMLDKQSALFNFSFDAILSMFTSPVSGNPVTAGKVAHNERLAEEIGKISEETGMSIEQFTQIAKLLERKNDTKSFFPEFGKASMGRVPWNRWNSGEKKIKSGDVEVDVEDVLDDMYLQQQNMTSKLNKDLKVRTRTQYQGTLMSSLPGMSKGELSTIQNLLPKGGGVNNNVQYLNPFTGELQSFEILLRDLKEREIPQAENFDMNTASQSTEVLFNPYNFGIHGPTMETEFVDKEGNKFSVAIPVRSTLSAPTFNALSNNPSYVFTRKIAAQNGYGVKNIVVPITLEDGNKVNLHVDLTNNFYKVEKDGTMSSAQDLTSALQPGGSIQLLYQNGARFD